jgi:hypothetical protein
VVAPKFIDIDGKASPGAILCSAAAVAAANAKQAAIAPRLAARRDCERDLYSERQG